MPAPPLVGTPCGLCGGCAPPDRSAECRECAGGGGGAEMLPGQRPSKRVQSLPPPPPRCRRRCRCRLHSCRHSRRHSRRPPPRSRLPPRRRLCGRQTRPPVRSLHAQRPRRGAHRGAHGAPRCHAGSAAIYVLCHSPPRPPPCRPWPCPQLWADVAPQQRLAPLSRTLGEPPPSRLLPPPDPPPSRRE